MSAAIDHAADLRTLGKAKQADLDVLIIERRVFMRQDAAIMDAVEALNRRIASLRQEIADCASAAREIGRGR